MKRCSALKRCCSLTSLALALAGCFDTHDREHRPELRPDAHTAEPADARAPEGDSGSATADAGSRPTEGDSGSSAADAGSPVGGELQIWLGAVRLRGVGGLGCGDVDPAIPTEERALLLLELDAGGRLRAASLTLGEGPQLPPVEDPNAYYPPDPPWSWHGCPMLGFVPGFEYTAEEARLDATRFSASIFPAEVVQAWCELQPSYRAAPGAAAAWGEYLCRPTDGADSELELSEVIPPHGPDDPFVPEELCLAINAPCACDADACTATRYGATRLDMSIQGATMTGRLGRRDIKLERQR